MKARASSQVELAIIGGGYSGLGVALAALKRGIRPTVFDAGALGHGTSASSLRIVHGGLRYLQSLNLSRMMQSTGDQCQLCTRYSSHIAPLRCISALSGHGLKRPFFANLAAKLYALNQNYHSSPLPAPKVILGSALQESERAALQVAPSQACLVWWDASVVNPLALVQTIADEIRGGGGELYEGHQVSSVEQRNGSFDLSVRQEQTDHHIRARLVVNASGEGINSFSKPFRSNFFQPAWARGFNLLLNRKPISGSAFSFWGKSGRSFFLVPRGDSVAIGTWYSLSTEDSAREITTNEVREALDEFNEASPGLTFSYHELCGSEVGFLPALPGQSSLLLYGSEEIRADRGYAEILSTKFTTFLSQGELALNKVLSSTS